MNLAMSALMVGMLVANIQDHSKKLEVPVEPFSHKYFTQLDKANTALQVYSNTPCAAPEFITTAQNLVVQITTLKEMEKNIPSTEDEITKAHEVEAFLGFVVVANEAVDNQNKCLTPTDKEDKKRSIL